MDPGEVNLDITVNSPSAEPSPERWMNSAFVFIHLSSFGLDSRFNVKQEVTVSQQLSLPGSLMLTHQPPASFF